MKITYKKSVTSPHSGRAYQYAVYKDGEYIGETYRIHGIIRGDEWKFDPINDDQIMHWTARTRELAVRSAIRFSKPAQ